MKFFNPMHNLKVKNPFVTHYEPLRASLSAFLSKENGVG